MTRCCRWSGTAVRQETWWNYSFTPIRDEHGDVVGLLNQGNETTRTGPRRTRAPRRGRPASRLLFEQAPGAVALAARPRSRLRDRQSGLSRPDRHRDVLGMSVAEALPEVIEQGFHRLLDQVYRTGRRLSRRWVPILLQRTAGQDAEPRMVDFVYQPIKDANGETTDIFVLANDVTDARPRKRRCVPARSGSSSRSIPRWVSAPGSGTFPKTESPRDLRFLRLYGVDDLAGSGSGAPFEATILRQCAPEDRPVLEAGIARSLASGARFSEEYRLIQPDGTVRWVLRRAMPSSMTAGRPLRFPGVSFDITDRKAPRTPRAPPPRSFARRTRRNPSSMRWRRRSAGSIRPMRSWRITSEALVGQLGAGRVGFYRVIGGDTIEFGPSGQRRLPVLEGTMPIEASAPQSPISRRRDGGAHDTGRELEAPKAASRSARRRRSACPCCAAARGSRRCSSIRPSRTNGPRTKSRSSRRWPKCPGTRWSAPRRWSHCAERGKFRASPIRSTRWCGRPCPTAIHDYYNDRWYEFTGVPHGSTDGEGWATCSIPTIRTAPGRCGGTASPPAIPITSNTGCGTIRANIAGCSAARSRCATSGHDHPLVRHLHRHPGHRRCARSARPLARGAGAAIARAHRAADAAEEQLRQAQKMEAVGQLTGGIAHDFNNMLAVVIGALDLLERRLAQGRTDVDRYVVAARDGATRAAALTQRLLAFSRQQPLAPDAGRCQCDGRRDDRPARPHAGRERSRSRPGCPRAAAGAGRSQPARERHPQPVRQRPRRDARAAAG
jgi:hypothetical protein